MARILDFQSFISESDLGGIYEANPSLGENIMVRVGNEIGKEGEPIKEGILMIDASDKSLDISKMAPGGKVRRISFNSGKMDPESQGVYRAFFDTSKEGEVPQQKIVTSKEEAKKKSYEILANILSVDQVDRPSFKFDPQRTSEIVKSLFLLKRDPKLKFIMDDNQYFLEFLKGLISMSNPGMESSIPGSLGEYKPSIDSKEVSNSVRSALSEINKK